MSRCATRRSGSARPRPRKAICAPTKSSRRRWRPARRRFIRATASCRKTPISPMPAPSAGLVFIGPPAAAIRAMGSKSAAKTLMEKAGVPLVPGYHGDDQDPALLHAEADRIGYPVLLKASAGGGGKGMRIVEQIGRLPGGAGVLQARSDLQLRRRPRAGRKIPDAAAPHRDPGVRRQPWRLRLPVRARLLGAAPPPEGAGRSAGARHDGRAARARWARRRWRRRRRSATSAPAPSNSSPTRTARFYFMEMNTRLQVEHPVTEMITGTDLVEWQLRVAAGEPLPKKQEQLAIHGHAIEARIYAENPEKGFLPSIGTLRHLRTPAAVEFELGRRSAGGRRGAHRFRRARGRCDFAVLRPDDRQADRLGQRPPTGAGAHGAGAWRNSRSSAWPPTSPS